MGEKRFFESFQGEFLFRGLSSHWQSSCRFTLYRSVTVLDVCDCTMCEFICLDCCYVRDCDCTMFEICLWLFAVISGTATVEWMNISGLLAVMSETSDCAMLECLSVCDCWMWLLDMMSKTVIAPCYDICLSVTVGCDVRDCDFSMYEYLWLLTVFAKTVPVQCEYLFVTACCDIRACDCTMYEYLSVWDCWLWCLRLWLYNICHWLWCLRLWLYKTSLQVKDKVFTSEQ